MKQQMKAFPHTQDIEYLPEAHGMDLRDYFAAQAMQALINENEVDSTAKEEGFDTNEWAEFVAFCSYKFADAMMKYRTITLGRKVKGDKDE
jgi:hypothetical protein